MVEKNKFPAKVEEGKVKKGGVNDSPTEPRPDPSKGINSDPDQGVVTRPEPTNKAPNKRPMVKKKKRKVKKKVMSSLKRITSINLTGTKVQLDKAMFHHMLESNEILGIDFGDGTTLIFWVSDVGEISRITNGELEDMKKLSIVKEEKQDEKV